MMMMPFLVRCSARIVTLMLITLTALHSTIAQPDDVGEGESASIENDDYMRIKSDNPFGFHLPRLYKGFGGSNIQISYRDDVEETDESIADEENQPKTPPIVLRRSFISQGQPQHFQGRQGQRFDQYDGLDDVIDKVQQLVNHEILNEAIRRERERKASLASYLSRRDEQEPEETDKGNYPPREGKVSQKGFDARMDDEENDEEHLALSSNKPVDVLKMMAQAQEQLNHLSSTNQDETDDARGHEDEVHKITAQDVDYEDKAEEEIKRNQDEIMSEADSQNLAYSYSTYVPNYQPPPQPQAVYYGNDQFVDHRVAPLSFVFHPTVIRSTHPNLLMQELKSYAVQLDRSPIMNALFSPSNVPIPSDSPAWPSKYVARRYLPPHLSNIRYNANPGTRRGVLQFNSQNINPELLARLRQNGVHPDQAVGNIVQSSIGQNSAAIDNFMQKSLNYPSHAISQSFDRNSQAMHNFFNQLRVPQFQAFPNFENANQYRFQSNQPNNFAPYPNAPHFQPDRPEFPRLNVISIPYISPNLRNKVNIGSPDDIDNGPQAVQLGFGSQNYEPNQEQPAQQDDEENDEASRELTDALNEAFDEDNRRREEEEEEQMENEKQRQKLADRGQDRTSDDIDLSDVILPNVEMSDEQDQKEESDSASEKPKDQQDLPAEQLNERMTEPSAMDDDIEDKKEPMPGGMVVMNQIKENSTDNPMKDEDLKSTDKDVTTEGSTTEKVIVPNDAVETSTEDVKMSSLMETTTKPPTVSTTTTEKPQNSETTVASDSSVEPTDSTMIFDEITSQQTPLTTPKVNEEENTINPDEDEATPEPSDIETTTTVDIVLDERLDLNAIKSLAG